MVCRTGEECRPKEAGAHPMSNTVRKFIRDHSVVNRTTGCWVWIGGLSGEYASVPLSLSLDENTTMAHRVSFRAFKGPIPSGFQVDHLCCNKRCVNPSHLDAVTLQENAKRAAQYRRLVGFRKTGGRPRMEDSRKAVKFCLSLPPDVAKKVKHESKIRGRSVSELISGIAADYLRANGILNERSM